MGLLERILAMQEAAGRTDAAVGSRPAAALPIEASTAGFNHPTTQKKKNILVSGI